MQEKRKKFWIGFGIGVASVVIVIVSLLLLTRLKTVNIEFVSRLEKQETMLEEGVLDKVLKSGDFDYGKNVLFMNFDDEIKKIEKENPYIKVHEHKTYFPNKVRITISERIPRFRIQDKDNSSKWYILDAEFKILEVVVGELKETKCGTSNFYDRTIEISPESLTLSSYIGEFVHDEGERKNLVNICSGVYAFATDYFVVKSIKIEKTDDFIFTLTMKNTANANDNGCKIKIYGNDDLIEKARRGVAVYHGKLESSTYEDISLCEITVKKVAGDYQITSVGFNDAENGA